MESKKIKTMAEKLEEKSIVGRESVGILFSAKASVMGDLPGYIARVVYDAQQAQTLEDVSMLEDKLFYLEDKLYAAARQISCVRHRVGAIKVDMLPKPKGEFVDE